MITLLRLRQSPLVTMDVAYVSDSMRDLENIAFSAVKSKRLLVMLKGSIIIIQIALNLAQIFERPRQLHATATAATSLNGFEQISLGVRQLALPRLKSLLY